MEILIDASSLMKELTGVGTYLYHLLNNMIVMDNSVQYTLFLNAFKGQTPRFIWENAENVRIVRKHIPGKILLELWRRGLPPTIETLADSSPSIFHSPNFFYQKSRASHVVATLHDLAFLKRTKYGGRYSGDYHRETLLRNIEKIDYCIVPCEAVKEDLITLLKIPEASISVIQHGINPVFSSACQSNNPNESVRQNQFPDRYILTVGTIEPRKNFPLLVQAFQKVALFEPDLHLIIAGKSADGLNDLLQAIEDVSLGDRIHLVGYVTLDVLVELYRKAVLAVFPSWDEGFGFPPLEALACGASVLASAIPVHQEILGDAALYFEPDSINDLEDLLIHALQKPESFVMKKMEAQRQIRLYSWEQAAAKHLEVYRKVIK